MLAEVNGQTRIRFLENLLGNLAFGAGFLLVAWLLARALAAVVYEFGVVIEPKLLVYAAILSLMMTLAWVYLRCWRGFLLHRFAAKPSISVSREAVGLKATNHDFVVRSLNGLRAYFEIRIPYVEQRDLLRSTHRPLRVLLRSKTLSVVVFEERGNPDKYKIDDGIEPQLAKIMRFENFRLKNHASRGHIRLHVCVEVSDIEEALSIAEENRLLNPLDAKEFAKGFFGESLLDQPGAVSLSDAKAGRIPGELQLLTGRFLPLLLTSYESEYRSRPNHSRLHDLLLDLQRPVLWHTEVFQYPSRELRRIKRVHSLEKAFPRNFLRESIRNLLNETPGLIEELRSQLESNGKPRLAKQVVWVKLNDNDRASVIAKRVQEHLFEKKIRVESVTPTRTLSLYGSLFPGLERISADSIQGLGIGGEEEEILNEMESVGCFPGHEGASFVLEDFTGKTLRYNLFEGGNNANVLFIGESGSGKSYACNGLLASHLARSRFNRAVVVDYGGSFSGLVQAIDGVQISFRDRARLRISPIPIFDDLQSEDEFKGKYPGQDYQQYLENNELLRRELKIQSFDLVRNYLCNQEFDDNAVMREAFYQVIDQYAKPGVPLESILDAGVEFLARRLDDAEIEIVNKALVDARNLLVELQSVVRTCPFIGDNETVVAGQRLVSFNLDGFSPADKEILVGLINLLVQQTFAEPSAGSAILLFDEVHKFIRTDQGELSGIGLMLDSTARVTRKYRSSLVLASQSPKDYELIPSLIENSCHHILMRLKTRELSKEWKITDVRMLEDAATNTEPAATCGFSTFHIGTTIGEGDIQARLKFRFTPIGGYAFTSKIWEKSTLDLALHVTGLPDYVELAARIHRIDLDREDYPHVDRRATDSAGQEFVPIGSARFLRQLRPLILEKYHPVKTHLSVLFRDPESNPLLDLFLNAAERARFETVSTDTIQMDRFLESEYGYVNCKNAS